MNKVSRLVGIDLLRGVAVYAVVILHADEGIISSPSSWSAITSFSSFAVPFFLATSFYLSVSKIILDNSQLKLKKRLTRLLIPYYFWTFFYIVYKAAKYIIDNETSRLNGLFGDVLSLAFCGGAAFHLYFLPLLITGTCLIKILEYFLLKHRLKLIDLILIDCLSLAGYQLLLITNNSFQNGSGKAFVALTDLLASDIQDNPVLRLFLIVLAWFIRGLPYLLTATILCHYSIRKYLLKFNINSSLILLILFVIINIVDFSFLLGSIHEIARGYITLLLGISLSNHLPHNKTITDIGVCSFGIYLMHLLAIEGLQIIGSRLYPEFWKARSTGDLLLMATIAFFLTWIVVRILNKQKAIARLKLM